MDGTEELGILRWNEWVRVDEMGVVLCSPD